jgi:O-antigen ligase
MMRLRPATPSALPTMSDAHQPPLRATAWEWVMTALLAANLVWTTLCLGGFRPETMVVTSALNALLLGVHLLSRAFSPGEASGRLHPAGWMMIPFLVYAAANVLWVTPLPWRGWLDWLGWAQMIGVFWVVLNGVRSAAARRALIGVLVALGVVAVLLACYQRFVKPDWLMMGRTQSAQFLDRSSGPFGIPNSLAAFLILLLPLLGVLTLRRGATVIERVFWGYLTVVFGFGLVLTISRGGWLALGLVLAGWPAVVRRGSLVRRLGWTALAGGGVVVLATAVFFAVPAARARLAALKAESGERTRPIMWRGAWQIFSEAPLAGGGAGSYDVLFEKFRPERYQDQPLWAHNDYLNTLSDYGSVGFFLFFGACAAVVWRCWRRPPPADGWPQAERGIGEALAAGLAAFALQLFVDFHFKIPALAMIFAVVAALWVQRKWPEAPEALRPGAVRRAGAALLALAVCVVTAGWVLPFYRGEALRYSARQEIDGIAKKGLPVSEWGGVLVPARASLRRAVELSPSNAAAWADLAYVTALSAYVDPRHIRELGAEAERAASRSLACSTAPPESWVRHGVALDMQGRWDEAGASFAEALKRGPDRAPTWFNYAFHLGIRPGSPDLAMRAVEFCLRLDPANKEAQALRQRLAIRVRAP